MKLAVIKFVTCSLLVFAGIASASSRAAEVQVRLTDGRTLHGSLDESQTSATQLALEVRSAGITIRRTLSWKQVASVNALAETKKNKPTDAVRRDPFQEDQTRERMDQFGNAMIPNGASHTALPLSELIVAAQPVSTYGKMDWDSLRLTLRGVDELGNPVPLFGTLQVTLWGQTQEPGRLDQNRFGHLYRPVPRGVEQVGTWTRQLDSKLVRLAGTAVPVGTTQGWPIFPRDDLAEINALPDYQGTPQFRVLRRAESGDVTMLLPFTRPLPDQNPRLGSFGEVTVQLLMPGVGVFEAATPNVLLSHTSPLRQFVLDREGTRFFPNEGTTDSNQPFGSIINRASWPERGVLSIQP